MIFFLQTIGFNYSLSLVVYYNKLDIIREKEEKKKFANESTSFLNFGNFGNS